MYHVHGITSTSAVDEQNNMMLIRRPNSRRTPQVNHKHRPHFFQKKKNCDLVYVLHPSTLHPAPYIQHRCVVLVLWVKNTSLCIPAPYTQHPTSNTVVLCWCGVQVLGVGAVGEKHVSNPKKNKITPLYL